MRASNVERLRRIEKKRQLIDAILNRIQQEMGFPPAAELLDDDSIYVPSDKRVTDLVQDKIDEIIQLSKEWGYNNAMDLVAEAKLVNKSEEDNPPIW